MYSFLLKKPEGVLLTCTNFHSCNKEDNTLEVSCYISRVNQAMWNANESAMWPMREKGKLQRSLMLKMELTQHI